jgi:hypothetical protein
MKALIATLVLSLPIAAAAQQIPPGQYCGLQGIIRGGLNVLPGRADGKITATYTRLWDDADRHQGYGTPQHNYQVLYGVSNLEGTVTSDGITFTRLSDRFIYFTQIRYQNGIIVGTLHFPPEAGIGGMPGSTLQVTYGSCDRFTDEQRALLFSTQRPR